VGPSAHIVGYWRTTPPSEYLGLPDPTALVAADWERDRRDQIVAYLRAGNPLASYAGFSSCRFPACGHPERARLGSKDLTDGQWIWPEGLWHYVRDHAVQLPDELVACAAAHDFVVPAPSDADAQLAPEAAFWLRWSAEHTAPPPAAVDACSIEDARTMCATLSTRTWRASVVTELGRWQLALATGADVVADYCGPVSDATLRTYLFAARRSDDDAVLAPERAVAIARELTGPGRTTMPFARTTGAGGRVWWAILSSGANPTRRLEDIDLRAVPLPEPGSATFLPGNWKVEVVPGMDELAWRFFLSRP
jgi:hypothetical protein